MNVVWIFVSSLHTFFVFNENDEVGSWKTLKFEF